MTCDYIDERTGLQTVKYWLRVSYRRDEKCWRTYSHQFVI